VLIVDDDSDVRELLKIYLEMERYELLGEAASGLEAVRLADRLRPDVIVRDVMMPGMNGIEATSSIKAASPDAVIIGFSSVGDHAAHLRMLDAGAAASFDKQDLPKLMSEIARLSPATSHSAEAVSPIIDAM
jgi:DNA-binding NarL/FixJ family response regulator